MHRMRVWVRASIARLADTVQPIAWKVFNKLRQRERG
jgi:hypothetical protein